MTIKKRLAVSNVLMLLVPIGITILIALGGLALIWFTIAHGTGVGFEDSETFNQASIGISELVEESLELPTPEDRLDALNMISSFLDRGAMSLVVTADGDIYYEYGEGRTLLTNSNLIEAAHILGNEGTISSGNQNLFVHEVNFHEIDYVVYLSNTQRHLSHTTLKIAVFITAVVLLLGICLSVFFTDRFLIRFVFRHIEGPLEMLADGVGQISLGNLDYRLEYHGNDEFLPVCEDFNHMAEKLKESVERSRREEESRKELMAGISHDLRSPLTSIQAYVEGLLDGVASTPAAQRKYLMTIKTKAEELERMVARILAYSRMEMEAVTRNAEIFQLDEYLKSELDAVAPDYTERGLTITHQLVPFCIKADKEELRQLLSNIADNSLKYKTKKHGTLNITMEDRGQTCLLCFTDDGPGVPEEALPKLFDVFFRTDPSRSDRAKGSGLGLSIVEKTVRRMGGRVWAENTPQSGLMIAMELPKGGGENAENSDY